MLKCLICAQNLKNHKAVVSHVRYNHQLNAKEYYDKFLKKENEGICSCGEITNFENINKGYRKFCSPKCMRNDKEITEKRNQTFEEKFGGHPSQNEIVKQKRKDVFNLKYGGHPSQNEQVKQKRNQTFEKRFGGNPLKNIEIQTKIKEIFKQNGGYPSQRPEVKKKCKQTWCKTLGVLHPSQNNEIKQRKKENFLKKRLPLLKQILTNLNLELVNDYINARSEIKLKCLKCNIIFESRYFYIQQGYSFCPHCYPKYKSMAETEILNFIKLFELNIIENSRQIINPLELDIFIPSKNIAIEYNGIYWHSEAAGKDKNYHLNKLNLCLEKGISLIQIFEDEWIMHQDIVKHRLKQILGVNDSKRIHARLCTIKSIPFNIKNEFLVKYHLQGSDNSPVSLGAFFNDTLIAVMTFNHGSLAKGVKNKDELIWELNRYCNDYNFHIPGIASKLLCYFKKNYEWEKIFSFADRRWSTGNLYKVLGFELESITKSNYWYVKGLKRIHRFNLRKKPDEPKEIPEWLLRIQEGYTRVWDCGNLKFVMENN